ncbi:MAG TPA: CoA-transferase [Chloroflexota bacterium]|nr:CoA-transferase [Chloroflexota bacterium]
MATEYSTSELMVVAGARELHDGEVAVVGLGIPLLAAALAIRTHAPGLIALNELGVADARAREQGVGNADARLWWGASFFGSFIDVMGTMLHRGIVDVGFLGALEVDQYGNSNTTEIVNPDGSVRRFNGSGGANDMASNAKRTIIIARHEARKLVERVSHLTSPGFLEGGRSREEAGLRGGGPWRVLTDKAVLGFDETTRRMKLVSVHPGVSHEELRASTGFPLEIPSDAPVTPEPSADEVRLIRELDPNHLYT